MVSNNYKITNHGCTRWVGKYIKNKLFLEEVDSFSQRSILTLKAKS